MKIMDSYITNLIPILPSAWEWVYYIIPTDLSFWESCNLKKKRISLTSSRHLGSFWIHYIVSQHTSAIEYAEQNESHSQDVFTLDSL